MKKGFLKFLLSKWTLIIAGILLVGIAGAVTALNWNNWFAGKTASTVSAELYWNVDIEEYAYKSEMFTSSRDVDKDDGYYHVLFANLNQQGRAVARRVKDKKLVDKIDTMRAMGLVFDEDNVVVDVIPMEDMGYEFSFKKQYVEEIGQDGQTIKLNSADALVGILEDIKLTPGIAMYDVTGAAGGAPGDRIYELKSGDCISGICDSKGKLKFVALTERTVARPIYWNVDRKWDTTKSITTREVSEDGLYHFLLAVGGEQKDFVSSKYEIAKQIDSVAARCFGLVLEEDGTTIKEFLSAKNTTGGYSFASWYDVTEINGKEVTACKSDTGTIAKANLAKNCQVYDVTGCYDSNRKKTHMVGEVGELSVGDTIHGLKNARGDVVYVFIVYKVPELVKEGYCSHCSKVVPWYKYTGTSPKDGRHFIATEDITETPQFSVGGLGTQANYTKFFAGQLNTMDIVLDLNGHKVSGKSRAIAVGINSKFTLMDTKGGGVLTTDNKQFTSMGAILWVNYKGKCDFLGGTIDGTGKETIGNGGCVSISPEGTFNMKGGTIRNGRCVAGSYVSSGKTVNSGGTGGCVQVSGKGTVTDDQGVKHPAGGATFNMNGGLIEGGYSGGYLKIDAASGKKYSEGASGGNVYVGGEATFNMNGGIIRNGTSENMGHYRESAGGNITLVGTAHVKINGAEIYGGKATNAANISVGSNKVGNVITISNSHIHDGKATRIENDGVVKSGKDSTDGWGGMGGNISVAGNLVLNNNTIENGYSESAYAGGNVCLRGDARVTMNGGVIRGGVCNKKNYEEGGNVGIRSKPDVSFTLNDGVIDGSVRIENGIFNLNGGAVSNETGAARRNIFLTSKNATLNVNGGVISGGMIFGDAGGNICSKNASVVNINGGLITGGKAIKSDETGNGGHGGNIYSASVININGGEIADGVAQGHGGGNISINTATSKLNITGGTIRDGISTVANKGNVYDWYTCGSTKNKDEYITTIDMSGGIVTSTKKAPQGYYGGGLHVEQKAPSTSGGVTTYYNRTIKLSGSAKVYGNDGEDIHMPADTLIRLGKLNPDAKFVTGASGEFATGDGLDVSGYTGNFVSAMSLPITVAKNGNLMAGEVHQHKLCVNVDNYGDKTYGDFENISFKPLTQSIIDNSYGGNLPTSGNWYLYEDITLTKQMLMNNGTLNLCFNNHTAKFEGKNTVRAALFGYNNNVYNPAYTCTASFCDCGTSGGLTREGEAPGYGLFQGMHNTNVELNIYGGIFDSSKVTSTSTATVFGCGSAGKDGSDVSNADAKCAVTIYGGTLKGGYGTGVNGGTVRVEKGWTFKMHGGTVSGGHIKTTGGSHGGNVYVANDFTMTGGTIENGLLECSADYKKANSGVLGGNMYVTGTFTMTGGIIKDGTLDASKITTDADKTRYFCGGNVAVDGPFNFSGGTISGGKILGNGTARDFNRGGNVLTYGKATMTGGCIKDGFIDNKKTSLGANLYLGKSGEENVISGGSILNGKITSVSGASGYGANVQLGLSENYTLTVSGSVSITGGNATYGGGIAIWDGCVLNLDSVTVSNNTATTSGGNIYIKGASGHVGTLNMNYATVSGGTATNGANIYLIKDYSAASIIGSSIKNGTASAHGDGIFAGGTLSLSEDITFNGNEEDIYLLSGKTIDIQPDFGAVNLVKLAAESDGVFALDAAEYLESFIAADGVTSIFVNEEGDLYYGDKPHTHKLCAGCEKLEEGKTDTDFQNITFNPLTQKYIDNNGGKMPVSGNWYLKENVNVWKQAAYNNNTVNLCFNGKTVNLVKDPSTGKYDANLRVYQLGYNSNVYNNSANTNLALCDCAEEQGGFVSGTEAGSWGLIQLMHNTNVNLDVYAGVLDSSNMVATGTATVLGGGNSGTDKNGASNAGASCNVNIYGGTLKGGTAPSNGVTTFFGTGWNVNMYGGTVSGGTLKKTGSYTGNNSVVSGANMCFSGNFNMYGGTVKDGTVDMSEVTSTNSNNYFQGGNIYTGGTFNLYGGTVSGGTVISDAKNVVRGGNISAMGAFNMYGGAVSGGCLKNKVVGLGANVYIGKSGVENTISAGKITGGKFDSTGKGYGANVAVGYGSGISLTVSGSAEISGGTGDFAGGGISVWGGSQLTLTGGTITDNTATQTGSNLAIFGKLVMTGGTVSAGKDGPNIYIEGSTQSEISGGTVTSAKEVGISLGGLLKISGAPNISGNGNGDIYLSNGKKLTVTDYTAGTVTKIRMQTAGVFAENAADYAAKFASSNSSYKVAVQGSDLALVPNN